MSEMTLRHWFAVAALSDGVDPRDVWVCADEALAAQVNDAERETDRLLELTRIGELAVRDWCGATDADKASLREAVENYLDKHEGREVAPAEPQGFADGVLEPGAHPAATGDVDEEERLP